MEFLNVFFREHVVVLLTIVVTKSRKYRLDLCGRCNKFIFRAPDLLIARRGFFLYRKFCSCMLEFTSNSIGNGDAAGIKHALYQEFFEII